ISAGTLNSNNNLRISVGGDWNNTGGFFTPSLSTVTFTGTTPGHIILSQKDPFTNVVINGSGGYWPLKDSMTITSTMTLTAGTLDTSSSNNAILLGGGWANTGGTFTAHQSTVTLNGASPQTISNAGQAIGILIDSNTTS